MGRLIEESDVSKLITDYFKLCILREEYKVDAVDCNADMHRLLKELPTAFDTERVVEELEKESYEIRLEGGALIDSWHSVIDKNKAIDIVRKGGVE